MAVAHTWYSVDTAVVSKLVRCADRSRRREILEMGGSAHRDGRVGPVRGWRRTPKGAEGGGGAGATLSCGELDANNIANGGEGWRFGGNERVGAGARRGGNHCRWQSFESSSVVTERWQIRQE